MNQLFIELYLDEDVAVVIAELLKRQRFFATTARDAGMPRASDEEHLVYASSRGMALVTHNRGDFERLAREWFNANRNHAGIFILVRRAKPEIAQRLTAFLDIFTADKMINRVVYL